MSPDPHAELNDLRSRLEQRGLVVASRAFFGVPGIIVSLSAPADDLSPLERLLHLNAAPEGWVARLSPHGGPDWIRIVATVSDLEVLALERLRAAAILPGDNWRAV